MLFSRWILLHPPTPLVDKTLILLFNCFYFVQVKRTVNRRLATYNISCLPFRRDSRRRRFGSMGQETTRRTDYSINCSMTTVPSRGGDGSSVGISGDIAGERTLEQKQKLLANGGSRLNDNRQNSNESHSMTTIDETEQECLLQGSEQDQPHNTSPAKLNANNVATGAYTKLNENPETTLWTISTTVQCNILVNSIIVIYIFHIWIIFKCLDIYIRTGDLC